MKNLSHLSLLLTEDIYLIGQDEIFSQNHDIETDKRPPGLVEEPIRYSGSGSAKVSILLNHSPDIPIPDEHVALLTKILDAVKLQLTNCFTINLQENNRNTVAITNLASDRILDFSGSNPFQVPLYELKTISGKVVLRSCNMDQLSSSVEDKKKLWNRLQLMFKN